MRRPLLFLLLLFPFFASLQTKRVTGKMITTSAHPKAACGEYTPATYPGVIIYADRIYTQDTELRIIGKELSIVAILFKETA